MTQGLNEFSIRPQNSQGVDDSDDINEENFLDVLSDTESEAIEQEEVSIASGDESLFNLLAREISDSVDSMLSYVDIMEDPGADPNDVDHATDDYIEIVERFSSVGEMMEFDGMVRISNFVDENARLIMQRIADSSLDGDNVSCIPLREWCGYFLVYLNAPDDKDSILEFVSYLQSDVWPSPHNDADAYKTLYSLTDGLAEINQSDSEQPRKSIVYPEDVILQIEPDIRPELLNAFFIETPDHAKQLANHIEAISANEDIVDNITATQRLAHTIKGSANLVGATGLANLTHHMEDLLEFYSVRGRDLPDNLVFILQEASDCIEAMVDALKGVDVVPSNAQQVLQNVLDWANHLESGDDFDAQNLKQEPIDQKSAEQDTTDDGIKPENTSFNEKVGAESTPPPDTPPQNTTLPVLGEQILHIPLSTADEIFRLAGEMTIAIGQIQEQIKKVGEYGNELRIQEPRLQQTRLELENQVDIRHLTAIQRRSRVSDISNQKSSVFDPLEMDYYDELYGSTHAFIEASTDSREVARNLQNRFRQVKDLLSHQLRVNDDLQHLIMTTRMVPVETVVSRLQRCVRQTARATNKEVELVIDAGVLVDADVLSKLVDPLMHILRNAVDHGIESPSVREDIGKQRVGKISLSFDQVGPNLKVCCEDDGDGLDYDRIRQVAIEKGLIRTGSNPSKQELASVILNSSFSTRLSATQLSGRGVGLDVVHSAVKELKGNIQVEDGVPSGCVFLLQVPITRITRHAAIVSIGKEHYAIPTSLISQILAPGAGKFNKLGKELTYNFGKEVYPAVSLGQMLSAPVTATMGDTNSVLLISGDRGIVAVAVNNVVSSINMVIKSSGPFAPEVRGIIGVSILGDGGVVCVLDPTELLNTPYEQKSTEPQTIARAESHIARPKVLIVDDSLSVRTSLSLLMEDGGYEPTAVSDGVEAMASMEKSKPDIVLVDLEMPRLNGFELTAHIRADNRFSDLPVVVVTSRTTRKHREQASEAGVNAYFSKPYQEDALLEKVQSLLEAN